MTTPSIPHQTFSDTPGEVQVIDGRYERGADFKPRVVAFAEANNVNADSLRLALWDIGCKPSWQATEVELHAALGLVMERKKQG